MNARTPSLVSKAPHMGTTIFTVMSALATEKNAVNLGQGFPDFPCDPQLLDLVNDAMREGLNQYPPMTGVAPLREVVSRKIETLYGRHYDPVSEITVTAGATTAGTVDTYNGSSTVNNVTTLTGLSVASSAMTLLKFAASTKNASSSGYATRIQHIALRKTA